MRVEFFNVSKKHLWTGDVGFPIPRIGETITFSQPEGSGFPNRVIHVHYVAVNGIGRSYVEVFVNEEGS